MYRERMNSYYPEVIQRITEFQAIIDCEYPEFEELNVSKDLITDNAYLLTMHEDRIVEWEHILGITPLENSSVSDRRETIIARIRGQGKLNSALISSIVNTFTNGSANSWISDGVLYVEITPPPDNKQYQFANVEQELKNKVPAHIQLNVARNYYTWGEIKATNSTWQDVKNSFDTWEDIYLFVPFTKAKGGI